MFDVTKLSDIIADINNKERIKQNNKIGNNLFITRNIYKINNDIFGNIYYGSDLIGNINETKSIIYIFVNYTLLFEKNFKGNILEQKKLGYWGNDYFKIDFNTNDYYCLLNTYLKRYKGGYIKYNIKQKRSD